MNFKKPVFWIAAAASLILIVSGILLFTDPFKKAVNRPLENEQTLNKGFKLYLVKEYAPEYNYEKADIDTLELEKEPFISKDALVSYHWELHSMKIRNIRKIGKELLERRFVVMVDGERRYIGAFWSGAFSMFPPKVCIYLDNYDDKAEYGFLALGSWRPGGEIEAGAKKVLDDSKVREVLNRDGQLFKPYQPRNFPIPDRISVSHRETQSDYAPVDWEKKDRLIQMIDERFVNGLNHPKLLFSPQEDGRMWKEETIISLLYPENQNLKYPIGGQEKVIRANEIIMPLTGNYSELMFFRGYDDYPEFDDSYSHGFTGYVSAPIGPLEKLKDIEMLMKEMPGKTQTGIEKPKGIHISWINMQRNNCSYELDHEEIQVVEKAVPMGKELKGFKGNAPNLLNLSLEFGDELELGKDTDKWFRVCDDGKTLFYNGKYYDNPVLTKKILEIAKEKCGYETFKPSRFKGLVEAKYSFRTHTRTFESTISDKAVLEEIEKGFKEAKPSLGGACPYNDGVLSLTFKDGNVIDIMMASDDCPGMFVQGDYFQYSKTLHRVFEQNFDNFPYVRSKT